MSTLSALREAPEGGVAAVAVADRPLRIAIVGNRDIAKFRAWIIRDLVAAGHVVFACAPDEGNLAQEIAALRATFVPFAMERTGINPIRDLRAAWVLCRLLRTIDADLVLSHGTKSNVIAPLAARFAGVPQVFAMIEGLGYAFTPGNERRRRALRALLASMFRVALRCCSGVFVLNEQDRVLVRAAGLVGRRQQVVKVNGTGVDLAEFVPSAPLPGPPRFLLIARLLREKGIGEYVAAARILRQRFPDSVFQLLGPFDSNPGAIGKAEVEAWQQQGAIEYLGESADVRPFLRACTVYVLPSYREGMPRTILEALAVGRPIVTTDVPGCQETVVEGLNGFIVPPRDVDALVCAMSRFLEEPDLVAPMGRASRVLAEARFDARLVNAEMMAAMDIPSTPRFSTRVLLPSHGGGERC